MPSKRDVAASRAKRAKRDKKHQRLLKADPSTDVVARLREARSSDVTHEDITNLVVDLAAYSAANSAMRRSTDYRYLALEKAYEVWMEISAWEPRTRAAFYEQLDSGAKITRGSGLHLLLRFLITYPDDARANNQAVSRDVGVLRHAARLRWQTSEVASGLKREGGLLEMYKADIAARKAERGAKAPKTPRDSSPPPVVTASSKDPEAASGDDRKPTIKTSWRGLTRAEWLSFVPGEHDVILFARINPYKNKITVLEGHLTQRTKLDRTARRHAVRLLHEAALIREKSVGKRSERRARQAGK